jgi:DedD protein
MPNATLQDTEITLGTGKLLALFFGLVALCAVFFSVGFSLGKNSVLKTPVVEAAAPPVPSTTGLHLTPVKGQTIPAPTPDSLAPATSAEAQPSTDNSSANPAASASGSATNPADVIAPPVLNGYYVQVAAVSKLEDADALVDALKKKQYPAFSAESSSDQLFHVQCGPYADVKDAEALRAKLVSDGYNPILKK